MHWQGVPSQQPIRYRYTNTIYAVMANTINNEHWTWKNTRKMRCMQHALFLHQFSYNVYAFRVYHIGINDVCCVHLYTCVIVITITYKEPNEEWRARKKSHCSRKQDFYDNIISYRQTLLSLCLSCTNAWETTHQTYTPSFRHNQS